MWYRSLIVAGWLATTPALAADDETRRVPFNATVVVAADGTAEVGEVGGVEQAIVDVLGPALGELPYVPAATEGGASASTVRVRGVVLLIPVGDEYEVAIEDLETDAPLLVSRPPHYPIPMLRDGKEGVVSLVLEVGADGRVKSSTVAEGRSRYFVAAAREAVADWRFQAPLDGRGFTVGAAFWFHGAHGAAAVPEVPCTVAPPAAHLPGDDGCLPLIETTGYKIRRSGL